MRVYNNLMSVPENVTPDENLLYPVVPTRAWGGGFVTSKHDDIENTHSALIEKVEAARVRGLLVCVGAIIPLLVSVCTLWFGTNHGANLFGVIMGTGCLGTAAIVGIVGGYILLPSTSREYFEALAVRKKIEFEMEEIDRKQKERIEATQRQQALELAKKREQALKPI